MQDFMQKSDRNLSDRLELVNETSLSLKKHMKMITVLELCGSAATKNSQASSLND